MATQRIYDATSGPAFNGAGIVTFVLGIVLSGWFAFAIPGAIQRDIHNFPSAFHSSPALTIFFVIFKLCSYVLFGCLLALMVYIPARNIFFRRKFSGHPDAMPSPTIRNGKRFLTIGMEQHVFAIPAASGLEAKFNEVLQEGRELRIAVGAFRRVIHIDVATPSPQAFGTSGDSKTS